MTRRADDAALVALASSTYVRLTTFRRDGTPVPTPVWVVADRAELGGRENDLLVTTGTGTGKAKRLRHTPRVLLAPCDARGRVAAGTEEVEAVAEVLTDPAAHERTRVLLVRKYPVGGRALGLARRATVALARLRRRPPVPEATLRIRSAGA